MALAAVVLWTLTPMNAAAEDVVIDGDSYACSFEGLRSAIEAAPSGSTITFNCPEPTNVFELTGNWIVFHEKTLIIDGANGGNQIVLNRSADSTRNNRFLTVENEDDVTLRNITIQNGNVTEDGDSRGAAIFNDGKLRIENGTFIGNSAVDGAAIYIQSNGNVTIVDSLFKGNHAFRRPSSNTGGNGTIFVRRTGVLTVSNTSFENNTSENNAAGIFAHDGGTATVIGGTFSGNSADSFGAAIFVNQGSKLDVSGATFRDNQALAGGAIFVNEDNQNLQTIEDSTFRENRAQLSSSNGWGNAAAIFVGEDSKLQVTNTDFLNNQAESHGGAVFIDNGAHLTLQGGTFVSNSSQRDDPESDDVIYSNGGAIFFDRSSTSKITDVKFESNRANDGGAILIQDGSQVGVEGSQFIKNVSAASGGAIFSDGNLTLKTSTFKENSGIDGAAVYLQASSSAEISNNRFESNKVVTRSSGTGGNGTIFVREGVSPVLTDNVFEANASENNAAGIFVREGATITVNGGAFSYNTAAHFGGAISTEPNTSFTVTDVTFTGNESVAGGAVYVGESSEDLKVVDSTFDQNKALFDAEENWGNGAAIYIAEQSRLQVSGTDFLENQSKNHGGAVFIDNEAELTLSGGSFVSNSTTGSADGGAIFIDNDASATATDVTFTSNTAFKGGAILSDPGSQLTILGGTFEENSAGDAGGAVYVRNSLSLTDATFIHNHSIDAGAVFIGGNGTVQIAGISFIENHATGESGSDGGAVFVDGPSSEDEPAFSIDGSTFTGNTSEDDGGAIYISTPGDLIVSNSTFTSNQAVPRMQDGQQVSGDGGAIHSLGTLIVQTSVFDQNLDSLDDGGAIYSNGLLTVTDSEFTNNTAGENGGAVFGSERSEISIARSQFTGNRANDDGGALYEYGSQPATITQSSFAGNTAGRVAGAIGTNYGPIKIDQTSFANNQADIYGGALFNAEGHVEILSSTFSENATGITGAAISGNDFNGPGTLTIRWTTIFGSGAPLVEIEGPTTFEGVVLAGSAESCYYYVPQNALSSTNSVSDDDSCQMSGSNSAAPLVGFAQTADVYGVTQTYYLVARSGPVHDAGGSACPDLDQLGQVRPQGAACELGAIEEQFFDYDPLVVCANRWNGSLSVPGRAGCGRGEDEVKIPTPFFDQVELCVNNWNGAVRINMQGGDCERSEHAVMVDGFGETSFCVNNWNGTMRMSQSCSRSEHQILL